jgi:hypothetical protein
MEQRILAATVRIKWHVEVKDNTGDGTAQTYGGVGHATIKDGRYLVTHNHFGEAMAMLHDPSKGGSTRFSIYKANGETLFHFRAPMTAFTVTPVGEETLVFDFGESRLFDLWGMASADFKAWPSLSLKPGTEVARVNWNRKTAYVEWTTIEAVIIEDGTPRVTLANSIEVGSSGGGIFWNGYHIANNWYRSTVVNNHTCQVQPYSVAALNPDQLEASLTEVAGK